MKYNHDSEECRRQLREKLPTGRPYFKRSTSPPTTVRHLFLTYALFEQLGRDRMSVDALTDALIPRFSQGGHAEDEAVRQEIRAVMEEFIQAKRPKRIGNSIVACYSE